MIVVQLMGGLGNQMFQYAFGRGVATILGRRLALDLSRLPTGEYPYQRFYELSGFSLEHSVKIVGARRLRKRELEVHPLGSRLEPLVRSVLTRRTLREKHLDEMIALADIPRAIAILVGYWQSPAYFDHISAEIRRELTPALSQSSPATQALRRIGDRPSVLIHVRRGDYVKNPQAATFHGVHENDYYVKALHGILDSIKGDPIALVLSDDPHLAEKELDLPVEVWHLEKGAPFSQMDALGLMSRCQHHVIANSSFSWWGAWLADSEEQRVFYPERWFATRQTDAAFRFPNSWTMVPASAQVD